MTLAELAAAAAAGTAPEVELLSVDHMVYSVRLVDADGSVAMLRDPQGKVLHFRSTRAAALVLGKAGVASGWLVHLEPWDEMVGSPGETQQPVREAMRFPVGED